MRHVGVVACVFDNAGGCAIGVFARVRENEKQTCLPCGNMISTGSEKNAGMRNAM